jgi:hypothetical protein
MNHQLTLDDRASRIDLDSYLNVAPARAMLFWQCHHKKQYGE